MVNYECAQHTEKLLMQIACALDIAIPPDLTNQEIADVMCKVGEEILKEYRLGVAVKAKCEAYYNERVHIDDDNIDAVMYHQQKFAASVLNLRKWST